MNVNAIPNVNLSKNTTITIGNIPSDVIPKMQVNQLAWNEQLMLMRFIVNVDGSVVIQPQQDYIKGTHNIKVQAVWDIA